MPAPMPGVWSGQAGLGGFWWPLNKHVLVAPKSFDIEMVVTQNHCISVYASAQLWEVKEEVRD